MPTSCQGKGHLAVKDEFTPGTYRTVMGHEPVTPPALEIASNIQTARQFPKQFVKFMG
jgi:hypothetical protein